MKKKFLITLLLLFINGFVNSQTDSNGPEYEYCQLLGVGKLFSNKVNVTIDYGQERKFFQDNRIKNEDGTPKTFNSMVDGMNFMGLYGWEFVQAYAITIGNQNVYHYLLKRKVK